MDKPFSPSLYVRLLARRWPLIVIPAIVALIAAAVVSNLMPVRYTATATMLAPNPQIVWRWDNKVYDIVDVRFDWRAEVMPLLTTADLAQRALEKVQSELEHPLDAATLLARMRTRAGAGALFTISVSADSAADARLLANALADSLPEATVDYYGGDLATNQTALDEAQAEFALLDEELMNFRGETGIGLSLSGAAVATGDNEIIGLQSAIKQEMTVKNSRRAALQVLLDRIDLVLDAADAGTDLPVTLLNLPELEKTYALAYDEVRQLAAENPAALVESLRAIRIEVARDYELLSADADAVQLTVSQDMQTWEQLLQRRGVWQESVTALARRDVELKMKRLIDGERVKVIDRATAPAGPSQPNWVLNLGMAVAGGLMLGLLLAVTAVYFGDTGE